MDLDKDLAFRADIFGHAAVRGLAYDMEIDKVFWTDGEHKFVASSCAKKSCVPDIIHNIALDGKRHLLQSQRDNLSTQELRDRSGRSGSLDISSQDQ